VNERFNGDESILDSYLIFTLEGLDTTDRDSAALSLTLRPGEAISDRAVDVSIAFRPILNHDRFGTLPAW